MGKSYLYSKERGIPYTQSFDAVTALLGANCGQLLGKIAGYCQMANGNCTKSQDDLAFKMGVSIKTVENCMDTLLEEGLIIDHTPHVRVPHKITLNERKIYEFSKKYDAALKIFEEIEQIIIQLTTDKTLRKKYVTKKTSDTQKLLRRYVNISYSKGNCYVKITHIINTNKILNSETLDEFREMLGKENKRIKKEKEASEFISGAKVKSEFADIFDD